MQNNCVIIVPDGAIDNTVVCEETSRTEQDLDTDSDTSSDNSDTDGSDSDEC